MTEFELIAQCVLSGQIPHEDIHNFVKFQSQEFQEWFRRNGSIM